MSSVKFPVNGNNKLTCPSFITIIPAERKYQTGFVYEIYLTCFFRGIAEIICIQEKKLNEVTEIDSQLSTGKPLQHTINNLKKAYPTTDWETQVLYVILFKYQL